MREPEGVRDLLLTDPVWGLYALGDLAPDMLPLCAWPRSAADPSCFALVYHGASVPVVQAFGEGPAAAALLAKVLEPLPRVFYVVKPALLDVVRRSYPRIEEHAMTRMTLPDPAELPPRDPAVTRLGPPDLDALRDLYADGAAAGETPPFFAPFMLERGVYSGLFEDGQLVAAAGTHLNSEAESVAAIGNVFTRTHSRGRGHARRVTAEVARELRRAGYRTIGLNVNRAHPAAQKVYQRLGFEPRLEYFEGPASRA